jgi:hypothetical protein
MRNIFTFCLGILLLALSPSGTRGASLLNVSDFEDGTRHGWDGELPNLTVVDSGGPNGEGDHFLQIVSDGGFGGRGSRLATFNRDPDWIGDYLAAGANRIELDMMNFTTTQEPVDMRAVLFGPGSTSNRFTSLSSITVPNDGVWRHYSFSLANEDLMRVQGGASYDDMITGVVRAMFRHDSGGPSSGGTPVVATLGVDNITLVGASVLNCDFNDDGLCDGPDIDALMNAVASGMNEPSFDLNGDSVVDDQDRDEWLAEAGPANGFAGSFLVGDANLDGSANAQDLNALALTWQTDNNNWTNGNFAGGGTNAGDLNALALNWQQNVPAAAQAVPEPTGLTVVWPLLVVCGISRRRRRRA